MRDEMGDWLTDPDQLTINIHVSGGVNGARNKGTTASSYSGLGGGGDIIVYNVQYRWNFIVPFMSTLIGDENGEFILNASVALENENFCGQSTCFGVGS